MTQVSFMESNLSKIRKGIFFRFLGNQKVYVFDGGGSKRGFNYTAADDINDFRSTKTDRHIEVGFAF